MLHLEEEPFLLQQLKDRGYYVWWGGKSDCIRLEDQDKVVNERFKLKDGTFHKPEPEIKYGHRMFYAHYGGKTADHPLVTKDEAIVQGAIDFINSRPPEPFAVCLTLSSPHCPFAVEEPYYSMYDREKLPPIIPKPAEGTKTKLLDRIRERMELDKLADADFKEILAVYYGMITKQDENLGRLMECLKKAGYWDDSALFVFSDHGEYAGDYRMVEKTQNTFEDDMTRVPLIIKYPSWIDVPKRSQLVDTLVELIDFYATVEELADLPVVHTHFGKSLVPLSLGLTDEHRDAVFCEGGARVEEPHTHETDRLPREEVYWPRVSVQNDFKELHGKAVMLRTKKWKYVYRLYERSELYDMEADPDELHNIIDLPSSAPVVQELNARMLRWFVDTGDVVPHKLDPRWPNEQGIEFTFTRG
jgi:arylsulfatase A-like enzyme